MPRSDASDRFLLEIPVDPAAIRTARLFAAAVCRHFEIPEETVEDVKLAVSEACTEAVRTHGEGGIDEPVRVAARPEPNRLVFEVVSRSKPRVLTGLPPGTAVPESGLGLTLIRALFDDAAMSSEDGGTVRFSVRFPSQTER